MKSVAVSRNLSSCYWNPAVQIADREGGIGRIKRFVLQKADRQIEREKEKKKIEDK